MESSLLVKGSRSMLDVIHSEIFEKYGSSLSFEFIDGEVLVEQTSSGDPVLIFSEENESEADCGTVEAKNHQPNIYEDAKESVSVAEVAIVEMEKPKQVNPCVDSPGFVKSTPKTFSDVMKILKESIFLNVNNHQVEFMSNEYWLLEAELLSNQTNKTDIIERANKYLRNSRILGTQTLKNRALFGLAVARHKFLKQGNESWEAICREHYKQGRASIDKHILLASFLSRYKFFIDCDVPYTQMIAYIPIINKFFAENKDIAQRYTTQCRSCDTCFGIVLAGICDICGQV